MQLQNSEADAMRNYVIVEANCRGCGKSRLKLAMEEWARLKSCPQCHHSCVCQYLGHGFSSDSPVDWATQRESAAVHEQPVLLIAHLIVPDERNEFANWNKFRKLQFANST